MRRIPLEVALMILLQSSISSSSVFAQTGDWKPDDRSHLGFFHKRTPVSTQEDQAPVTSKAPYSETNGAFEANSHSQTTGKLHWKGTGNVINRRSTALTNPSTNSAANASGAPNVSSMSSRSNGLNGMSKMNTPSGGNSSTNSRDHSRGSNPATNFFLRH